MSAGRGGVESDTSGIYFLLPVGAGVHALVATMVEYESHRFAHPPKRTSMGLRVVF